MTHSQETQELKNKMLFLADLIIGILKYILKALLGRGDIKAVLFWIRGICKTLRPFASKETTRGLDGLLEQIDNLDDTLNKPTTQIEQVINTITDKKKEAINKIATPLKKANAKVEETLNKINVVKKANEQVKQQLQTTKAYQQIQDIKEYVKVKRQAFNDIFISNEEKAKQVEKSYNKLAKKLTNNKPQEVQKLASYSYPKNEWVPVSSTWIEKVRFVPDPNKEKDGDVGRIDYWLIRGTKAGNHYYQGTFYDKEFIQFFTICRSRVNSFNPLKWWYFKKRKNGYVPFYNGGAGNAIWNMFSKAQNKRPMR